MFLRRTTRTSADSTSKNPNTELIQEIKKLLSKLRKAIICPDIRSFELIDYNKYYNKYKKVIEDYHKGENSKTVQGFFQHDLAQIARIIEKTRNVHAKKTRKQHRNIEFYKTFGTSPLDMFNPELNEMRFRRLLLKKEGATMPPMELSYKEEETIRNKGKFFKDMKNKYILGNFQDIKTMCDELSNLTVIDELFNGPEASIESLTKIKNAYKKIIQNVKIDEISHDLPDEELSVTGLKDRTPPVDLPDEELSDRFAELSISDPSKEQLKPHAQKETPPSEKNFGGFYKAKFGFLDIRGGKKRTRRKIIYR
jgi:hypothetical protein